MTTVLLATVALAVMPTFEFTSDSTYKKDKILDLSVTESTVVETDDATEDVTSETVSYTLNVKENYVLGYDIYDDPNTEYVDGIKVDGEFLSKDWDVKDFDPAAEHVITLKTVYSKDVAGWFAMAKDGDFSAILSNPLTVLQLVYYGLAALSIILGGFGLYKFKKLKAKSAEDIAQEAKKDLDALKETAERKADEMKDIAFDMVKEFLTPTLELLSKQNDTLIKATVLARSGDEASTLALLDLLKETNVSGIENLATDVKQRIKNISAKAAEAKRQAVKDMKEAVAEISAKPETPDKPRYDGTSI